MTRDQIERAVLTSPSAEGRRSQLRRVYGIENYLHIGGGQLSAMQVAIRLGVTKRTVERWRAALREAP